MNRYTVVGEIGKGSAGQVSKAIVNGTGETVAIKHIKNRRFTSFGAALAQREVNALRRLRHPNILRLLEVIRENEMLFLVLEYADGSLYQWMRARTEPPSEAMVRTITHRLLLATAHVHKHGFVHRDIKPMNVLVSSGEDDDDHMAIRVKLCDFGTARELRTASAANEPLTPYVSTRWYRAPEVLLRGPGYSAPVDLWALGAIIAEIYTLRPLFPGATEIDQIDRIANVLGAPYDCGVGAHVWVHGCELVKQHEALHSRSFPRTAPVPLSAVVPQANADGLDLISALLRWDPAKRLTARDALRHPFVSSMLPLLRYVPLRVRSALLRWARRRRAGKEKVKDAVAPVV